MKGYIVTIDDMPAQWCDDGQNYGFYLGGRHATVFPSRRIAKRRVRWAQEADEERNQEHPTYPRNWRYRVLLVKGEHE